MRKPVLQVEIAHVEFSAFRDKHDAEVSALESSVYKLELDNRQLERQLMILTNSDMKMADASENRLVKLMAENGKVNENAPATTVGTSAFCMHAGSV